MSYKLIEASRTGNLDLIKDLISKGADIHAQDDEALRWASKHGHLEIVNYLEGRIVRENLLTL